MSKLFDRAGAIERNNAYLDRLKRSRERVGNFEMQVSIRAVELLLEEFVASLEALSEADLTDEATYHWYRDEQGDLVGLLEAAVDCLVEGTSEQLTEAGKPAEEIRQELAKYGVDDESIARIEAELRESDFGSDHRA